MEIKEGAQLAGLKIEMRPALLCADAVWKEFGRELVVTAGLDGAHSAGSLHYYGLAVDFRTRFWPRSDVQHKVASRLRQLLSDEFDVILHRSHIHVEYDPKV